MLYSWNSLDEEEREKNREWENQKFAMQDDVGKQEQQNDYVVT